MHEPPLVNSGAVCGIVSRAHGHGASRSDTRSRHRLHEGSPGLVHDGRRAARRRTDGLCRYPRRGGHFHESRRGRPHDDDRLQHQIHWCRSGRDNGSWRMHRISSWQNHDGVADPRKVRNRKAVRGSYPDSADTFCLTRSPAAYRGLTAGSDATHNAWHDTPVLLVPTPLRNPRGASMRPTTVTIELPDVTTRPQNSAAFWFSG